MGLWVVTRLLILATVLATAYSRGVQPILRRTDAADWLIYRVAHWDSFLYAALAVRGYPPPGATCCYQAFFPGFPALMKALAPTATRGEGPALAGFVITQCAGLVAAALLWRLAVELSGSRREGWLAVGFVSIAPLGVFFTVVYTESLFLALSLAAWLCGVRGRWRAAGLLAGAACTVRFNGLFLVAALVVMYLLHEPRRQWWRPRAAALAVGPVFVVAWIAWLHARTGLWDAITVAEKQGWHRQDSLAPGRVSRCRPPHPGRQQLAPAVVLLVRGGVRWSV